MQSRRLLNQHFTLEIAAIKQVLAALRRDPNVRVAEPNYIRHASSVPNDPSFPDLWGLQNTGQLGGTAAVVTDIDYFSFPAQANSHVTVSIEGPAVQHGVALELVAARRR